MGKGLFHAHLFRSGAVGLGGECGSYARPGAEDRPITDPGGQRNNGGWERFKAAHGSLVQQVVGGKDEEDIITGGMAEAVFALLPQKRPVQ